MFLPLLGVLLAVPAPAEGAPEHRRGPAPTVVAVTAGEDGRGFVEMQVTTYQDVKQTYTVRVGERIESRERVVSVPVTAIKRVFLDDKDVTVYDTDGRKIAPEKLPKLTRAVPALLSADGKEVPRFYLRVAREGTLVIVAPRLAGPSPVPGPLPPRPPLPAPPVEKR